MGRYTLSTAGRYQVAVEFDGPPQTEAALLVFTASGAQLAYIQGQLWYLRPHSASCLIIETDAPARIRVAL